MRRWRPLTTVLVAVLLVALAAIPARAAEQGIRVVSSQQLDSRLTELTLSTPALRQPTHVRHADPFDGAAASREPSM